MVPIKLLRKLRLNPKEPIIVVTAQEALSDLMEAIEEYCSDLKIEKMSKQDLLKLLNSYANCIIEHHPEDNYQERVGLLENFKMLQKYGLIEKDYDNLISGNVT